MTPASEQVNQKCVCTKEVRCQVSLSWSGRGDLPCWARKLIEAGWSQPEPDDGPLHPNDYHKGRL